MPCTCIMHVPQQVSSNEENIFHVRPAFLCHKYTVMTILQHGPQFSSLSEDTSVCKPILATAASCTRPRHHLLSIVSLLHRSAANFSKLALSILIEVAFKMLHSCMFQLVGKHYKITDHWHHLDPIEIMQARNSCGETLNRAPGIASICTHPSVTAGGNQGETSPTRWMILPSQPEFGTQPEKGCTIVLVAEAEVKNTLRQQPLAVQLILLQMQPRSKEVSQLLQHKGCHTQCASVSVQFCTCNSLAI